MHSLLERQKKAGGGVDAGLELPAGSLPQPQRMFSCVGCFWVLLSSCLVAVCSFSFLSPAWIVKEPPLPQAQDETSAVLCSGGCALLAISSLLAIIAVFLPSGLCERRVCTLAGYMQTAAVFIMASGLLVYPFGLNSATVKKFCENSAIYYAGDCQIGWGYMLAIVGVMLSVFLPFFAKYAPKEHISPTPIPTIL
ncbi:LHFPL tetraspan subfamily member 7 protein isoform X2 [Alligator mississippiensis]|uniref:LHFPL tetraspan subfamily member 7 protein isoform X2 n=1 Tax=Alligator mississippiensis TaxID=8496 RepID=UPI0028773DC1|nr:LHFPL tetraspan subfamily member 7 protein isoform X2 [Alligator mississippiensis]